MVFSRGFGKGIKPIHFDTYWKEIAEKVNPFRAPLCDGDDWHNVQYVEKISFQ